MPRRKGLGLPPKRRAKLDEPLEVNHANIRATGGDTIELKTLTNGHSGHSGSEEEPKRELHNGDRSQSSSPKSVEENIVKNGLLSSDNDKFLYTHKKFKKMATIAPFNYVSTPSSPPVVKPPPLSLKMPVSTQATPVTPCSPSTEYLHRHISKLISENQAIVETTDPYLSKKFYQRTKQEKEPASPNRSHKVSPRTVYTSPPPAPHTQWHPLILNSTPSSPLLVSSASYEAAYIKSLMSPSPSSPLSSASSSSSTEFTWPRKPQQPTPQAQQLQLAWQYQSAMLSAKQQAESKLASALLRPNSTTSSNQTLLDEDASCQPLNLTVKQTNHVDSKSQSRKRSFNSCFPDETNGSQERVKFSVDSIVSEKPKCLFISPEVDLKSQMLVHKQLPLNNLQQTMLMYNSMDPKANLLLNESLLVQSRMNRAKSEMDYSNQMKPLRKARSPMKVFPPLPSPGPLLGSTPLIDTRSHIPTLRSLEELSRSPMGQQHAFQMFGGEVQIRDAIGDAKTLRIEPNKLKASREIDHSKSTAKLVTMAKSAELNSGGTTILQVPQPSENAKVPKNHHDHLRNNNTLLIPVMSKPHTPTVPLASSPHVMTSSISAGPHLMTSSISAGPHVMTSSISAGPHVMTSSIAAGPYLMTSSISTSPLTVTSPYNGGVLTLLHAGKAIPHVPGIPGPLSMTPWEDSKTEVKSRLSAEVKPMMQKSSAIKNGRLPCLSESAKSPRQSEETSQSQSLPSSAIHPLTPHLILTSSSSSEMGTEDDKSSRFLRPTSLPLKPGTYTPKQHLSSTASQSLVSPETPRPRKGYGQLYLNGHAYTYLGLKCSTRLFFCTLNKPQPLYAPLSPEHCKVSMYSNWKICTEVDPNPFGLNPAKMMACYCSSTRPSEYTVAQSKTELQVTHSSYWYKKNKKKRDTPVVASSEGSKEEDKEIKKEKSCQDVVKSEAKSPVDSSVSPSIPVGALVPEVVINEEETLTATQSIEEKPKRRKIFTGGFESNEDYIYIRGRGRGRFVCEECGIRCRKPSMLKKHIKTHSDVRLYTCTFCSFSFKTKGNLTKHMKSKAHFKKCVELGVSPMPSSEDLSGDEKHEYRNSHSSESMDTEPGESDDDDDDNDEEDDDDCSDDDLDDESDITDEENEEEDDERMNSELEHDVAHSLLSLARMPPQSTTSSTTTTVVSSTMNSTTCTTTMITLPSATAVSVLPTVRDSEKAAMSILPPTSPNSLQSKPRAEFLPPSSGPTPTYVSILKDGRSMCGICNKIFTKPSQLRLHVNIHYFERPFRCEACAVSFRTKGHLQKHQRSSSHLNKVNMNSTFGTPTTTNPRPFKCDDCKIAFRIHGHLAKHLRSKMHIMKLECGGKLPFGTYAELERCGYNLNDIDTTDCDNSLESLQLLAQKLYEKDPSKLGGWVPDMLPPVIHTGGSAGESSDEGDTMETEQAIRSGMPVHVK